MKVPFVDLRTQCNQIGGEALAAIQGVVQSTEFVLGTELSAFEAEFASYCEAAHAVGTDTGLSALELSLRALDIGPGDEVITVSNTFIATVAAISVVGARPVFVDICPDTYLMDVSKLEAAITPRTRAILPVHLYGQPADMTEILTTARRHGLFVVADACQAHGARYRDQAMGAWGDAVCFSFYPSKNLGAFGDGGIVVTNNAQLAERVRMLRNYGQSEKYRHQFLAYNRRLDSLQAAVLRIKLRRLDSWNQARAAAARLYHKLLSELPDLVLPIQAQDRSHVWHLYVIQHPSRDRLLAQLGQQGVSAGIHYPVPVHRQPCYESLGVIDESLPITSVAAGRILSLPMYPEITEEQIVYVCDSIKKSFSTSHV